MTVEINPPFRVFTDVDGEPLEDGFIHIGAVNQNPQAVPISVFWDQALTIPAAQPIRTLGGYPSRTGTPSRMYVAGDAYSISVLNKNSTLIYSDLDSRAGDAGLRQDLANDTDPAKGAALVGYGGGTVAEKLAAIDAAVAAKEGFGVRLEDYATPSSGVSETANIQTALDTGASVVDGGGLTYRADTTISLKPNQTLQNCTLDFSNATVGITCLSALGAVAGPYPINSVSAGGLAFTTTTASDAGNFAPGDYVRYRATNVFDASNTNTKVGEIVTVNTADAGTGVVTPYSSRLHSYTAGQEVERIDFLEGVVLRNVTVLGIAADENALTALQASWCKGLLVDNCQFYRMDTRCIFLQDCVACHVVNSSFYRARPTSSGYGISFADATQDCSAIGNYFENVRHSLSTNNTSDRGGVVHRIVFEGNTVFISAPALGGSMGGGDAIDTHGAAQDIVIRGNTVHGSTGQGINVECSGAVISGNVIRASASAGISVHNESDFPGVFLISDNLVIGADGDGVSFSPPTRGATTVDISARVHGNQVSDVSGEGVSIGNTASAQLVEISVANNSVKECGSHGILLQNCRGVSINGNTVTNPPAGSNGLRINTTLQYTVSGNTIRSINGATAAVVDIRGVGTARGSVTGNVFETALGSTALPGIILSNDVTYTGVWSNVLRGTAGITLGSGTGNVAANNIL